MTRVLIVDDRRENLEVLRALLQASGCEVEEARHGGEALAAARIRPPDLVISDLLMPVMDGFTLLRNWKADPSLEGIPFVVHTATYTEAKHERLARDLGADAFIVKPIEPEPFMKQIREVLGPRAVRPPIHAAPGPEKTVLREYSEILVRKLEEKAAGLEEANRDLRSEIGHRTRAEAATHAAHLQLNRVFERVTDAFVALDNDWRYTYVNARAAEMFGRRAEDLIGKHIWTEFPEGVGQTFHRAYERAMAEQQPVRFEDYYPPYGRWFENVVYPAHDGLSIYFHDVTERKQAEMALQEAEARLRLTTEGSDTGLWDWDLRTNEVYFSPIWKRQIGYEDHEIPNRFEEWESRVHPDDLRGALARVQTFIERPGDAFENEFRFRHRDGSYRWILARASLLFDKEGRPARMLGSHIDITERKEIERSLEESRQQLRALLARLQRTREEERIRISREIHDELGQLLTGAKMELRWVERKLEAVAASGELGVVIDHVVSASELTDSTIAAVQRIAAELRPGALDRLGLDAALSEELRRFEQRSGVRAVLRVSGLFPRLPQEVADEVFYICREALTNVARHAHASNVEVRLGGNHKSATVDVADDGDGIDETALAASSSLGLLGMRERALQAQFEIRIERGQPRGTTVRLVIPREQL